MAVSNKKSLLITSCDAYPGYRYAQWALKYRDHFSRVYCAATDKSSEFMRVLSEMGGELVEYDLKDESGLKRCFEKVDYVHVIPPLHQERAKLAVNLLRACGKAGVEWVCLCSVLNCDQSKGRRLRELHEVEQEAKRAGIKNLCICREGFMLETLFAFSEEMQRGKFPFPGQHGRFAPVSMDDTSHGILRAMMKKLDSQESGKVHTVELTGRQMVDGRTIAEKASERLNMRIQLEETSMDRIKEILRRNMKKSHDSVIEMIVEMLEMICEGKLEKKTDDLQKLLGSEPMSVDEFFEKNQREFKP